MDDFWIKAQLQTEFDSYSDQCKSDINLIRLMRRDAHEVLRTLEDTKRWNLYEAHNDIDLKKQIEKTINNLSNNLLDEELYSQTAVNNYFSSDKAVFNKQWVTQLNNLNLLDAFYELSNWHPWAQDYFLDILFTHGSCVTHWSSCFVINQTHKKEFLDPDIFASNIKQLAKEFIQNKVYKRYMDQSQDIKKIMNVLSLVVSIDPIELNDYLNKGRARDLGQYLSVIKLLKEKDGINIWVIESILANQSRKNRYSEMLTDQSLWDIITSIDSIFSVWWEELSPCIYASLEVQQCTRQKIEREFKSGTSDKFLNLLISNLNILTTLGEDFIQRLEAFLNSEENKCKIEKPLLNAIKRWEYWELIWEKRIFHTLVWTGKEQISLNKALISHTNQWWFKVLSWL